MRDGDATIDLETLDEPLAYGRDAPLGRGWRARHALVGVGLAACVASSWLVGRHARDRAQAYLYERQAAVRVEPADTVVFDADPLRARLLADAGTHERLDAASLDDVAPGDRPAVRPEPAELAALRDALAEGGEGGLARQAPLLFLHELTSSSGVRRIVAVRFLPWVVEEGMNLDVEDPAGLVAHVLDPGGLIGRPRHVGTSRAPLLLAADEAGDEANPYAVVADAGLRWYAGQPDALDASHFTLAFEVGGRPGTVDGFLSADGSEVRMAVRLEG